MVSIGGIIVPILTPMNEDESINVPQIRNEVNRMIDAGLDGIFPFGTNGEAYALSAKEKEIILETVIDEVRGRVPVYAGTGCITTKETIAQSKMARDLGADVLSVITPSFAAASQDELYEHFKAVAEAVPEMPIVLYNIPPRTINAIAPATLGRLAKIDNIVGAKDSSGSFVNILAYIEAGKAADPDFAMLSGNDQLIIWTLLAGGKGGIAGCANVYPRVLASIYDLFKEGKIQEAIDVNAGIASFRACFRYGNPNTIIKIAAGKLGNPVGKCRAPFNKVVPEGLEELDKVLAENKTKGMS